MSFQKKKKRKEKNHVIHTFVIINTFKRDQIDHSRIKDLTGFFGGIIWWKLVPGSLQVCSNQTPDDAD